MAPLHVYGKQKQVYGKPKNTYSKSLRTPGRAAPLDFAQFLDEPEDGFAEDGFAEARDGAAEQTITQWWLATGKDLGDEKVRDRVRGGEAGSGADRDARKTRVGDVPGPAASKSKTKKKDAGREIDVERRGDDKEMERRGDDKEMESLFRRLNLGSPEKEERTRKGQVPESMERHQQASRRSSTKVAVSVAVPKTERQKSLSLAEEILVFNDRGQKTGRLCRHALEDRDANAMSKSQEEKTQGVIAKQKRQTANTHNVKSLASRLEQISLGNDNNTATTDKPESTERDHSKSTRIPATPTVPPMTKAKKPEKQDAHIPRTYADDGYTTYVSPLLPWSDKQGIVSFDEWAHALEEHVSIEKIAEASFSEVYRLTVKDPSLASTKESVLKLVGLKMPPSAPLPCEIQQAQAQRSRRKADNSAQLDKEKLKRQQDDQWKSAVADVLGEVRLLQNLTSIPGFTIFRSLSILQGRPPPFFAQAWRKWNKARSRGKKSHYPDPTYKTSYEATQLWAVIEMDDAGTDVGEIIENGGISTIWEVWDVFWSVCLSVAKAEEACRFEHRDLHMDNICVRALDRRSSDLTKARIRNPLKRKLGFSGLETTVIDYTLSRADIVLDGRVDVKRRTVEVAYLDLDKDQSLFEGDADVEYQYEIYRYMWGVVYHDDPLNQKTLDSTQHAGSDYQEEEEEEEEVYTPETPRRSPRKHNPNMHISSTSNSSITPRFEIPETPVRASPQKPPKKLRPHDIWRSFHPKTNLIWAHFILHTLLQHLHSLGKEPASLSTEKILADITLRAHSPHSGSHSVSHTGCSNKEKERIHRKAIKLHKALTKVGKLLEPRALGDKSRVQCVGDLVVLGLEAEWLGVRDVTGA